MFTGILLRMIKTGLLWLLLGAGGVIVYQAYLAPRWINNQSSFADAVRQVKPDAVKLTGQLAERKEQLVRKLQDKINFNTMPTAQSGSSKAKITRTVQPTPTPAVKGGNQSVKTGAAESTSSLASTAAAREDYTKRQGELFKRQFSLVNELMDY